MEDMTPEMRELAARVSNAWGFAQSFMEGRESIQWEKYRENEQDFEQLYAYLYSVTPHLEEAIDHFDDSDRARWMGHMMVYTQRLVVEHLKNDKEKFNFVAQKIERLLKDMLKKVTVDQMLAELDNLADNEKANNIDEKSSNRDRSVFYSRALPHHKLVMLVAQMVHGLDKKNDAASEELEAAEVAHAPHGQDACCESDAPAHGE